MSTTEKFKDPITISKLPSECFDEIFKYLKFDRRSLYSCLFLKLQQSGETSNSLSTETESSEVKCKELDGEVTTLQTETPASSQSNKCYVHKLTHLVLDDMIFSGISLTSLYQCTRLESFSSKKCRSLTLESIQPILNASIRLKFLHLSELPKEVVKAIFIKAGDALEQASVKFISDDINEGLETLVNHCQNITHLS
ncbi:unnamed protein product [Rhizophagus irregularis]|nr:unnamed protein product [Rhizophagus irregularis]